MSAPDDHFTASPNCRVNFSGGGGIGRVSGYPTIRAGIVSAAGINVEMASAPDDHFIAGPDGRVQDPVSEVRSWC